jgi:diguanylate cyclase (GGDEF)-like protein
MFSAMSQTLFRISQDEERSILQSAAQDAEALSDLLEVQIGDLPDVATMLTEADEALARHQLSLQRETELLRQSGEAMTRQAMVDGLTGLGNRRRFEKELDDGVRRATGHGRSFGLILVDVDRFTSINDTLGQQAADLVLRALADRLREGVGSAGVACRHGGQAFAVILPGATTADTARTAERLRRAIERQHVDLPAAATRAEAVQVTASFGVAALEPMVADRIRRPELLVHLANRALLAAKQAGRNCVRVFTPGSPNSSAA